MKLSDVKKKYRSKAKEIGSLFLLKSSDCIEFINDCVSEGMELTGVEGFIITKEGAIQPHQEHSNDISDTDLDAAIGVWFEAVMLERCH